MPVTQRKRSFQLFRKLKFFTKSASSDSDEAQLDIDKMMLHCLGCLGAVQCVLGRYDSSKAKVFWGAVMTIAEIGLDSISGHVDRRHPGGSQLLRVFPYDSKASEGRSWLPLHWAAVTDNVCVDDVRSVAKMDPLVLVKGSNSPTASPGHLIAAVRQPNMDVVRCLYNFYPRMASMKDGLGDLPLHYAARYSESVQMISYLLEANPLATSVRGDNNLVPLQCAIYNESEAHVLEIMKCLLTADRSASNIINEDGDSTLHLAVNQDCDKEVISLLLEAYPQAARVQNDVGQLPLHFACTVKQSKNAVEIVKLLLQIFPGGAEVECSSGHLPIHLAAEYSCASVLHQLTEAYPGGISRGCSDDNNNTALMKAVISSNNACIDYLCKNFPTAAQQLNSKNQTALHFACETGDAKIVKMVYDIYPEAIRTPDITGKMPLHQFLEDYGDHLSETDREAQCLLFLLSQFPEAVNHRTRDDESALQMVCTENAFVRRLLLRATSSDEISKELRKLNYGARREAIFLAFAAVNAEGIPNIFCRIRTRDANLFKHVISFL